jgi:hypothetical protein
MSNPAAAGLMSQFECGEAEIADRYSTIVRTDAFSTSVTISSIDQSRVVALAAMAGVRPSRLLCCFTKLYQTVQQAHSWPDQASRPSLTKSHTIASDPTPSIHHAPKAH